MSIDFEIIEIISLIRQNRKTNSSGVKEQKRLIEKEIQELRHQTSDGLEIWRISHIPQKDGELDMMLISCNILLVLK
jgi:hypothetical protein